MELHIYPDGGCEKGNGAWAFVCLDLNHEAVEAVASTTSNKMELTAIIRAIEWAVTKEASPIFIYSDSQYCVKGYNTWMHTWERNGWQRVIRSRWGDDEDYAPVLNLDLWQRLWELKQSHGNKIRVQWIKGHAGTPGNERADQLVKSEYTKVFGGAMKY